MLNCDDCMADIAKFYLGFCVDESCGKCAPCRIGGTQMLRLLQKVTDGLGTQKDLSQLEQISFAMQKASLCGLGQTAPNPVLSTLHYYRAEYDALRAVAGMILLHVGVHRAGVNHDASYFFNRKVFWKPVHRPSILGGCNVDAVRPRNPASAKTPPCIPVTAGWPRG